MNWKSFSCFLRFLRNWKLTEKSEVKYLISFDGDFNRACKEESIKLIDGI
jgi:hypothetical protein